MYKVFINDKTIFLIDNINKESVFEVMFHKYKSKETLLSVIEQFEKSDEIENLFIYYDNPENLLKKFINAFTLIEAAGGLVKNSDNQLLFIFRKNKWDLPKGKIEKNEKIETAAIREVEEECGLTDLKIIKKLPPTYHIYTLNDKKIIKKTYWFEMVIENRQTPIPQTTEDIIVAKWIRENEINEVVNNTYKSIKELMKFY